MPDIGARNTRLRIVTPPISSGLARLRNSGMHKNKAPFHAAQSLDRLNVHAQPSDAVKCGRDLEIAGHCARPATMRLGMEKRSDSSAEHIDGPVAVVIVAAGRGERAGQPTGRSNTGSIGGRTVIAPHDRTLSLAHPDIGPIVVVIHADDEALFRHAARRCWRSGRSSCMAAQRGRTRLALACLRWREKSPGRVLIHDAARPFVDAEIIDRVIAGHRRRRMARCRPCRSPTR